MCWSLASTENSLSKDGAGDLKLHPLCSLSRSNVRLNYMGGMSGPGCQRLGAISERVHLSSQWLLYRKSCWTKRGDLCVFSHITQEYHFWVPLANPHANNERNKTWPRSLWIILNGLRLYWFGNEWIGQKDLEGRSKVVVRGSLNSGIEDKISSGKKSGQRFVQGLHQRRYWMASKHMKTCSPSWFIRDHTN